MKIASHFLEHPVSVEQMPDYLRRAVLGQTGRESESDKHSADQDEAPDALVQTLDLLCPNAPVALSALHADDRMDYRYFDDHTEATAWVRQLPQTVKGVYLVMNPFTKTSTGVGVSKSDITRLRWLLIDCDPKREKRSNATEWELALARDVATKVHDYLTAHDWPAPLVADSGNGAHLLCAIDLPNDAASTKLLNDVLKHLARFNTPGVDVDQSTGDANQLTKLYGTVARKGSETAERPHRLSTLTSIPAILTAVPLAALQALVAVAPKAETQKKSHSRGLYDLDDILAKVEVFSHADKGEYAEYQIRCPWSQEHSDPDSRHGTIFTWSKDGAPGFTCPHHSCKAAGRDTWKAFRDQLGLTPRVAETITHLTDVGNAVRFATQHRDRVLYCYALNSWFVYDGRLWQRDTSGHVMRLAKATVATIYAEAAHAPDNREAIAKWAVKSESADRLNALLKLAQSEMSIEAERLDANPSVVNCLNGTLDLRDYMLRPHRAEDYLTKIAPVEYGPSATSALWTQFLETALPDEAVRIFTMKIAGITLDGASGADILPLVHGGTRTGKGTFQEALSAALGDYAIGAELDLLAERDRRTAGGPRPELLRLRGARMVSVYETSRRLKLSVSLVKTVTGSDPVTARDLYEKPITFAMEATFWIATNYEPNVPSDDDAIWERIHKIPFTVTISREKRDPGVRRELRDPAKHGAAILAWAVAGHRLWKRDGLIPPKAVETATETYRAGMNPLHEFIKECCLLKPNAWSASAPLRKAYHVWAGDNNEREVGPAAFQEALRQLGCSPLLKHAARGWQGIGLIDATRARDEKARTHEASDYEM